LGEAHVLRKPPAGAGGVTHGDYHWRGWANGRMVMDRVIPLASARGFWVGSAGGMAFSARAAPRQGRCLVVIDLR
jgi:hypothetical protein